jgi:hypothetical protein
VVCINGRTTFDVLIAKHVGDVGLSISIVLNSCRPSLQWNFLTFLAIRFTLYQCPIRNRIALYIGILYCLTNTKFRGAKSLCVHVCLERHIQRGRLPAIIRSIYFSRTNAFFCKQNILAMQTLLSFYEFMAIFEEKNAKKKSKTPCIIVITLMQSSPA